MRLAARRVAVAVTPDPSETNPTIVLALGGLRYRMGVAEAICLVNEIADAVESIPNNERNIER